MYTFDEISKWVSNDWKNDGVKAQPSSNDWKISGVSHDTRTLKPGEVYIAVKGENHDGHDFVEQAVAKGAAGIIVEKEFPTIGKPQLIVPDTRAALWQIAAGARAGWKGTVIGVTGSAGKTTVKEMIAAMLSQKGVVSKTPGNWNNDIGLPLSMIGADRNSDFFVFELGMNHPGEIDLLAGLLKPDWALVTNIGKAHVGFFQSLEPTASGHSFVQDALGRIADEKATIFRHSKHAILDADSEWFDWMKTQCAGSVTPLTTEPFRVAQPGAHMVQNARFAATLGLELGLSPEEIQGGLDLFENAPMRWQIIKNNEVVFINDAYNANPLSMRAALSTFAELPCSGRRFAVLGGMRELGESEAEEHFLVQEYADSLGLDQILWVGSSWPNGIKKNDAVVLLREQLREGDRVLLKASRGERLETILEDLK